MNSDAWAARAAAVTIPSVARLKRRNAILAAIVSLNIAVSAWIQTKFGAEAGQLEVLQVVAIKQYPSDVGFTKRATSLARAPALLPDKPIRATLSPVCMVRVTSRNSGGQDSGIGLAGELQSQLSDQLWGQSSEFFSRPSWKLDLFESIRPWARSMVIVPVSGSGFLIQQPKHPLSG